MWTGKKKTPLRPSAILLIDSDEASASVIAQILGARGAHVFYTAAAHVGRRLSQEHYFDLVVVDDRVEGEDRPPLSEVLARHGHRCVILSVPRECRIATSEEFAVRGAVWRPLDAERIYDLAEEVVRNGSYEGYKQHLDLVR